MKKIKERHWIQTGVDDAGTPTFTGLVKKNQIVTEHERFILKVAPYGHAASHINLKIAIIKFQRELYNLIKPILCLKRR